jgi:hypothetical protein
MDVYNPTSFEGARFELVSLGVIATSGPILGSYVE